MLQESHAENVTKSVSPHFSSGVLSLESFVQILDDTPHDISRIAARRTMPHLLGLVNEAHKGFQLAESEIKKINDKVDDDLLNIVVQEKTTDDGLCQTQEEIAKLEEREKVLTNQQRELERQLTNYKNNLRRDRNYLQERQDKLRKAEEEWAPPVLGTDLLVGTSASALVAGGLLQAVGVTVGGTKRIPRPVTTGVKAGIIGGFLFGPVGAAVGYHVASAAATIALMKDIANAKKAVSEASSQVTRTKDRIKKKNSELSNLAVQKEKQRKKRTSKSKELKRLRKRKNEIKDSQVRLGKLNKSIKSCMMLVSTTTTRANMMAFEANGQLPDIEAIIVPLKAIAKDLSGASLSSSRLLSGNVDIKGIGCKIQMITSKVQLAVTQDDMDEWV